MLDLEKDSDLEIVKAARDLDYYRKKGNGLPKDLLLVGVGIVLTLVVVGLLQVFI